jgi:hypothetical protein
LKKAGKSSDIATLIKEQNDKPPLPKSNGAPMRQSQDRFVEERKESRANLGHLGAQVVAGQPPRNKQAQTVRAKLDEFANAP